MHVLFAVLHRLTAHAIGGPMLSSLTGAGHSAIVATSQTLDELLPIAVPSKSKGLEAVPVTRWHLPSPLTSRKAITRASNARAGPANTSGDCPFSSF